MAKATARRVNLNLTPSIPSIPRPPTRKSHAHLLYALNLSHHVLAPHGASSTIPMVVAFTSRSFISPFTVLSAFAQLSNKRLSLKLSLKVETRAPPSPCRINTKVSTKSTIGDLHGQGYQLFIPKLHSG
jgi:hypothetical protein